MVIFQNVSKFILSNVNVHIPKGSIVGIIGASGAGKTTLLKLACGLLEPREGMVYTMRKPAVKAKRAIAAEIGVLFADIPVFQAESTLENSFSERKWAYGILRPRGLLFQLIFSNADWFAAVGHGGLGILLFLLSAGKVGVVWNGITIGYYIVTMIGGVLIQGAVFLILATLNIYLLETNSIKELFYWNARKFAGYPISIFHRAIQFVMIYVVPFAFINYFPAQFLLRKEDMAQYPEVYMYLTPFVGVGMYLLAYLFWRKSIKHYKSSGN